MTNEVVQSNPNPFAAATVIRQAPAEAMVSRQAQEVQAAMVIAKKFPRDETAAYERIMRACKRKVLAEQAVYAYPRGDTTVEGPSIRLAEALAQAWGNVDFGIIELDQKSGESSVMAYAWDLETNTRQTKVFTVKHERHTRKGSFELKDPRDIYEMTANQGARRLRACILGVIPGDVVDAAVSECSKTLSSGSKEPLQDRVKKMVVAFGEMGVTTAMIEKRVGHRLDSISEAEFVQLKKIYVSLRDNMADRSAYFDTGAEPSKPEFTQQPSQPETDTPADLAPKPAHAQLAALLADNGFTFEQLRSWGAESKFIQDAEKYGSIDDMPVSVVNRVLNASEGLIRQLKARTAK